MVALGVRGDEKRGSKMGRETHLLPVVWEKESFERKEIQYEWHVVALITGKLERQYPVPFLETMQRRNTSFFDNFQSDELGLDWNFRRVPASDMYLLRRKSFLLLNTGENNIKNRQSANLLGFRQTESDFEYSAKMSFKPKKNESEAGISLVQKDDNYFTFTISKESGTYYLKLVLAKPGQEPETLVKKELEKYNGEITFKLVADDIDYQFYYSLDTENFILFHETEPYYILSKGYTGAFLGAYATSNGHNSKDYALYDWVRYVPFERR